MPPAPMGATIKYGPSRVPAGRDITCWTIVSHPGTTSRTRNADRRALASVLVVCRTSGSYRSAQLRDGRVRTWLRVAIPGEVAGRRPSWFRGTGKLVRQTGGADQTVCPDDNGN